MGEGRSRDPKSLRKIWTDLKENQKDKHKNSVPMIMINLEHLIGFCILVQDDKHGNWCPLKCSILKNLVSLCEVVKDDNHTIFISIILNYHKLRNVQIINKFSRN